MQWVAKRVRRAGCGIGRSVDGRRIHRAERAKAVVGRGGAERRGAGCVQHRGAGLTRDHERILRKGDGQ